MIKKYIFLITIFSLILMVKTNIEDEINIPDFPEEGFDYNYNEEDHYFKSSLKEYLLEKDLYDSNRPIKPNELRKIFLEVISEGDPKNIPSYLKNTFNKLAEHFIVKYYNENKQITGKDIINLFDINEINSQFDKIVGDTTLYDIYGEEEDDQDNRDAIGEPKTEL